MEDKKALVKATGLDPQAPYSLGNKEYYYEREIELPLPPKE